MGDTVTAGTVARYVGGGLVLVGTVGIGALEMALGTSHPVSGEGQIEHGTLVPLEVRSYVILAGLLVWGAYAAYTTLTGTTGTADSGQGVGTRRAE